jgi:hypothetical protein
VVHENRGFGEPLVQIQTTCLNTEILVEAGRMSFNTAQIKLMFQKEKTFKANYVYMPAVFFFFLERREEIPLAG